MTRKTYICFSLVILLGVILRLFNPAGYVFGFDQVQILENAQMITQGKLTLIGPRTGPAAMFTGPLIYYLNSLSYLIIPNVYSLLLTSSLIFIATSVTLVILGKLYLKSLFKTFTLLLIWAVSPLIVILDRTIWNPNLSLLAASMTFFPLIALVKRPPKHYDLVFLLLGSLLGFQAHFAGLLLPILVLIIWLISIRRFVIIPLIAFMGLGLTLLPIILFDLRHHFTNLKGLLSLVGNKEVVSRYLWFDRFWRNLYITIENQGKLFFRLGVPDYVALIGLLIVALYFLTYLRHKTTTIKIWCIPIIWLGAIALVFSAYRQTTPEYYYLIQLPALMYITVEIFSQLYKVRHSVTIIILTGLTIRAVSQDYHYAGLTGHLSLGDQLAVSEYLHHQAKVEPISQISYQMPHAQNLGLEFLLKDITVNQIGTRYLIVFPVQESESYFQKFGIIGINLQPY